METVRYILVALAALVILVPLLGFSSGGVVDKLGLRAGRKVVEKLGFEVIKSSFGKGCFKVVFRRAGEGEEGKTYTCKYQYFPGQGIKWLGHGPEEVV
ncbi:MAG: hypothetical protein ACAI34_13235 [Verrucomicrobium sp.]